MSVSAQNLIWIDLEMTGLEPQTDRIIEIATIVTNGDLDILAEGPIIAVHQSDVILHHMDEWNTNQHGGSGLVDRVRGSAYNEKKAEQETIDFLQTFVSEGASPMCGNSICQDRRFMANWMPNLEEFFHYRNLDVSALKEMAIRWAPDIASGFTKNSSHQAMDDIKDSIAEMKYYMKTFLKI